MRRDTLGKLLGLAGIAGVAATGVVLARDERQRRAYSPDDVRSRLHERAAATSADADADAAMHAPHATGSDSPAGGEHGPAVDTLGKRVRRHTGRAVGRLRRARGRAR